MATITTHRPRRELTPQLALRVAWYAWAILLLAPLILLAGVVLNVAREVPARHPDPATADAWFIGALVYIGLAAPAAFFVRGRIFGAYWLGKPVTPAAYLTGTLVVLAALELGGILALVGCMVTGSLPLLLPALLALGVYTLTWPTGQAMTPHPITDDPQLYKEPR